MNIRIVNLSKHPFPSYETGDSAGMDLRASLVNTPGTIAADYRGEIKRIVINLSQDSVVIEDGERVAQMIAIKILNHFRNVSYTF